jgi:uncharacterized protein YggE
VIPCRTNVNVMDSAADAGSADTKKRMAAVTAAMTRRRIRRICIDTQYVDGFAGYGDFQAKPPLNHPDSPMMDG